MKYDVRFCSCGRIHFVPFKQVNRAWKEDKELLLVCNNCGNRFVIGADDEYAYTRTIQRTIGKITEVNRGFFKAEADGKLLRKILFSDGYPVYMKTGNPATQFAFGAFYDGTDPYFMVSEMFNYNKITEKQFEYYKKEWEEYKKNRATVDMHALVNKSGMSEDQVMALSYYVIENFDWANYPYGHDICWCKPKENYGFNNGHFAFDVNETYKFKYVDSNTRVQLFQGKGYIFLNINEFKKKFNITKGWNV